MITGQATAAAPAADGYAVASRDMAGELERGTMIAADAPGLCRRRVRDTVRAARQARGLTQQQAAAALGWSLSKLARIETGRSGITVTDLRALLTLYQVSQDRAGPVIEMARAARTRPWHARYPVAMTVPGLARYLEEERSAAQIRGCAGVGLPELLQTPDYARAVLTALGQPRVDERIDLLLARQQLLDRDDCPDISYLIDEGALHRPCGGPAVMGAQLRHLADLAAHPRISVRVVPFTAGAYPPLPGISYTIFDPPDGTTDAVYLETASGSVICRPDREEAERYLGYLDATHQKSAGLPGNELLTHGQAQAGEPETSTASSRNPDYQAPAPLVLAAAAGVSAPGPVPGCPVCGSQAPREDPVAAAGPTAQLAAWLADNYHRHGLRVSDIAAAAGVSVRRLQALCQRDFGRTPMQLLAQIRLHRAHLALTGPGATPVSLAEVARSAGFARVSRFASAYRRRYGTAPALTARITLDPVHGQHHEGQAR
jgi:AraC-like DNA-binding protein/transcriptional regulator with XRE-family HTH domain